MGKDIKKWTENIENILLEQQKNCAAYKWMHERDSMILKKRSKYMSITTISIVSFSATISTLINNIKGQNINNEVYITIINIVYPIFLYISAVLSALQQFLEYEKEADKHRTTSIKYTALYNNIKRVLSLDPDERQNVNNYFTWVNKEYDSIFNGSPDIISSSLEEFDKKFGIFITQDVQPEPLQENEIIELPVIIQKERNPLKKSSKSSKSSDENVTIDIQNETIRLKYELDRYMQNSYS